MKTRQEIVVSGGGPAGVTAALRARELGAAVTLVERGRMGGTCTNDGCAPTRVLAKAARLVRDSEQLADYGLHGERPEVDLPALLARTQEQVYRLHEKKQLLEHLQESGIRVHTEAGNSHFLDAHTLQLDTGTQLLGDRFILCAGGHARRLRFPGSEAALTHSDVWSLQQLPRSLVIVGAAATGCQLASIFAAFGTEVSLLDIAPQILGGEDELTATVVADAFRQNGIHTLTGIGGLARVERQDGQLDVIYLEKGQEQRLRTDAVIMAVGWVGNLEELNLEAAGIATTGNYVQVDDTLRTNVPHIYAAGDITGRMMLVQSATQEARIAADNAVLDMGRRYGYQIVPHGGFTDPEYGSVGLTERQAREIEACAVAVVPYADLDRAVVDGRTTGFCKLIVARRSHQIVGAHVVGEQAVEVIQAAAAGMAAGIKVQQLAELELAYPTYTAILGLAARQLVRELSLTPLAQEWRSLIPLTQRAAEWERGESEETLPTAPHPGQAAPGKSEAG